MNTIEFTNEELYSLYRILDQLNVSGISSKQMILSLLIKLDIAARAINDENQLPTSSSSAIE